MTPKAILICGAASVVFAALGLGAEKKPPPWEKPVQTGRYLYLENCSVCHEVNRPDSKKPGPVLYRVFEQDKMPFSGLEPSEEYVKTKMKVGGGIMPSFAGVLTDDEIESIVTFLKSKK